MNNVLKLLETYTMVLVHPFRIHHQFRHRLPLPDGGEVLEPLSLAESLGISWIFSILQGLTKILILNLFIQSFMSLQSESFPVLEDIVKSSGISAYYFLIFKSALDIIFFPVATLVMTQVWAWVIKFYAERLNDNLPAEDISDQITTHALSSNLFGMIPFLGDVLQPLIYYFLLYAGIRANLGASRSLAMVILLTPTIAGLMILSLVGFLIFYLAV